MATVSDKPGCVGCPMQRLFPTNTFVEPKIGKGLRLIIGEAPGSTEAETGEPFAGQAGGWLKSILPSAGINIADVTISNCISCRPLDNIFPTDSDAKRYISPIEATQAVTQCQKNYIEPLLKGRPWTRIDLLGDKALQLVAKKDGGIYKWRGSPLKIPALGDQYIAIATLHPAAIARDQSLLPAVINDFRKSATPPPEFYNLFPSVEDVRKFTATEFAFDIETTNWKLGKPEITMVGLSAKANNAIVVPFKGAYVTELQRIFAAAVDVAHQNGLQFDIPLLEENGVTLHKNVRSWDVMLLQHLRFPDLPHDLEFIGSQFTSKPAWKQDKGVFELYNARDTDVTFQAYQTLKPLIEQYGLKELYELVQVPLARICKLMHARGFRVDPTRIEEVRAKLKVEMAAEEAHLPEHLRSRTTYVNRRSPAPAGTLSAKTGKPVKYITVPQEEIERPWASSTVIAAYLYDELKLPVQINPKSEEITTGKVALEKLYRISKNRSVESIRRLRKKASIINLFAKEEMIASGVQYPHFNVHGTASGRLSSSDPNLQNIPESARFLYVPHTKGNAIIECLAPDSRVLKSDLTWQVAQELQTGDTLIGFDEYPVKYNKRTSRRLRPSIILNKTVINKPCYEVVTDKGSITVSDVHGWLKKNKNTGNNYKWTTAADLRIGDKVAFFITPWKQATTKEEWWLSGLLDGEGYVSKKHQQVGFGQNDGLVYDTAVATLEALGLKVKSHKTKTGCNRALITGEPFAGLRILGQLRPVRLLHKAVHLWEGRQTWGRHTAPATIQSVVYLGEKPVVALTTSTKTLIAEGFLQHNCDFSQIENRLTAHLAGDKPRLQRFLDDPSFSEHKYLASQFLGIPYAEVEKSSDPESVYIKAKKIVHGTNYGEGAKKIAMMNDLDMKEVKLIQDKWKGTIAETTRWQTRTAAEANKLGYLTNPFGRKRWFYTSSRYTESLSFLPQSTAADMIFRAMLALMYERINWPLEKVKQIVQYVEPLPAEANLLLQVHDSLIIEAPPESVDKVVGVLKRVMEQPFQELDGFWCPIGVAVGPSWGEAEKWLGKLPS